MFNGNFLKLCQILSLSIIIASAVSKIAEAEEEDYYHFPTGEHEGGGVRGTLANCAVNINAKYPIPLVPDSEGSPTLTTSPSPELFFDIPDVVQASSLEVVLLDRNEEVVYQNSLETGYQPGIIGLNLSDDHNSNALKINDLYHWYLVQECENSSEPKIVAKGALQRIKLDRELAQKIDDASGLEKVKLYQQANIWHEAIALLAEVKCNSKSENTVSQQKLDEELDNIDSLTDRSFENYCLNDIE